MKRPKLRDFFKFLDEKADFYENTVQEIKLKSMLSDLNIKFSKNDKL